MLQRKPKNLTEILGQFVSLFEGEQQTAVLEFVHDGIMFAKDIAKSVKPTAKPPDDIPDMRRR